MEKKTKRIITKSQFTKINRALFAFKCEGPFLFSRGSSVCRAGVKYVPTMGSWRAFNPLPCFPVQEGLHLGAKRAGSTLTAAYRIQDCLLSTLGVAKGKPPNTMTILSFPFGTVIWPFCRLHFGLDAPGESPHDKGFATRHACPLAPRREAHTSIGPLTLAVAELWRQAWQSYPFQSNCATPPKMHTISWMNELLNECKGPCTRR